MKCVILAGGKGTRIAEESRIRPKPMVEIGGKPILWHIMKLYSHHGVNDFVICLGYLGYVIKEYFANYFIHNADFTVDILENSMELHQNRAEPWRVTLVDTGDESMTGGRIRRIRHHLNPDEPFCMTYGDGLADIDVAAEIEFHRNHRALATIATVHPPARFGSVVSDRDRVLRFEEKPQTEEGRINGGFFVLSPAAIDLIEGDHTIWEREPLERLAGDGQLRAWQHDGFWQPMDTLREKLLLESLWSSGDAPWKLWE